MHLLLFQNKILWVDEKNLTACCEAGIIGQDLERRVSQAFRLRFKIYTKKDVVFNSSAIILHCQVNTALIFFNFRVFKIT